MTLVIYSDLIREERDPGQFRRDLRGPPAWFGLDGKMNKCQRKSHQHGGRSFSHANNTLVILYMRNE